MGRGAFILPARASTAVTGAGSVNVTTATTAILAANADRLWARITNISGVTIYLGFGTDAVANAGYTLVDGASFTLDVTTPWQGTINGIHASTGNKAVTIVEI